MTVYLHKEGKCVMPLMTATDTTVTGLKLWDTNSAWATHVQHYLMINGVRQRTAVELFGQKNHM